MPCVPFMVPTMAPSMYWFAVAPFTVQVKYLHPFTYFGTSVSEFWKVLEPVPELWNMRK